MGRCTRRKIQFAQCAPNDMTFIVYRRGLAELHTLHDSANDQLRFIEFPTAGVAPRFHDVYAILLPATSAGCNREKSPAESIESVDDDRRPSPARTSGRSINFWLSRVTEFRVSSSRRWKYPLRLTVARENKTRRNIVRRTAYRFANRDVRAASIDVQSALSPMDRSIYRTVAIESNQPLFSTPFLTVCRCLRLINVPRSAERALESDAARVSYRHVHCETCKWQL